MKSEKIFNVTPISRKNKSKAEMIEDIINSDKFQTAFKKEMKKKAESMLLDIVMYGKIMEWK